MALVWCCAGNCRVINGAASGSPDVPHWHAGSGTPTIDTTNFLFGNACVRTNAAGASVSIDRQFTATLRMVTTRFRVQSFPGAVAAFQRFANPNGNLDIECDASGNITAKIGAGARSSTIGTVSTGTWNRLDALADTSTGTASLKVSLNGSGEQTATNAQTSANMTSCQSGPKGAVTMDVLWQSWVHGDASTDYDPADPLTCEPMSPTRDGTHSFTAGDFGYDTAGADVGTSDTTVWQKLDDDLNNTTDLIRQKVIRSTGYVEVGFGTPPHAWAPLALNAVASFHAAGTGADTFGLKMNDGGTLSDITDPGGDGLTDVSQTSIVNQERFYAAAPSGAWTNSILANLLIRGGYSTDVNAIPYWDAVMLEVVYGPQPVASLLLPRRTRSRTLR